jgi:hypothetical protein
MYQKLDVYILLSQEERQKHLDLESECIEIGGGSKDFRALLAHFLRTTIPASNQKILLCHACHNAKCSNPKHLYWGTYSENLKDAIKSGARKNLYELTLDKYKNDPEALKKLRFRAGRSGLDNHKTLTHEVVESRLKLLSRIDFTKIGWVGQVAEILNFSSTQAKRFIDKHYDGRYGVAYRRNSPMRA